GPRCERLLQMASSRPDIGVHKINGRSALLHCELAGMVPRIAAHPARARGAGRSKAPTMLGVMRSVAAVVHGDSALGALFVMAAKSSVLHATPSLSARRCPVAVPRSCDARECTSRRIGPQSPTTPGRQT